VLKIVASAKRVGGVWGAGTCSKLNVAGMFCCFVDLGRFSWGEYAGWWAWRLASFNFMSNCKNMIINNCIYVRRRRR